MGWIVGFIASVFAIFASLIGFILFVVKWWEATWVPASRIAIARGIDDDFDFHCPPQRRMKQPAIPDKNAIRERMKRLFLPATIKKLAKVNTK